MSTHRGAASAGRPSDGERPLGAFPGLPPGPDEPREAWVMWFDAQAASAALALRCVEGEPGRLVVEFEGGGFPPNPNGAIHGGMVVAAADQIMGQCAHSVAPGKLPATVTLTTTYLRPSFGPLTYTSTVVQAGRTLIFVEAYAEDQDGRRCATFSGSWVVAAAIPR